MTANEMLQVVKGAAKMINEEGITCYVEYPFSKEQLIQFLDQYSKEQRENCSEEADNYGTIFIDKDTILNAKQPDITI